MSSTDDSCLKTSNIVDCYDHKHCFIVALPSPQHHSQMYFSHICIHVKYEKFKRGRSPSLHLVKEGDFAQNKSVTFNFGNQHSNSA